jgi:hypothetical protein
VRYLFALCPAAVLSSADPLLFGLLPADRGLSFLSIAFDVVFVVQHYVLYRESRSSLLSAVEEGEGERGRLLVDEQ